MSNDGPIRDRGKQEEPRSEIDRRAFLRLTAAGGAMLTVGPILAACGEDETTPATAAPTTEAPTTTAAPATTTAAPDTTAAPATTAGTTTTAAPTTTLAPTTTAPPTGQPLVGGTLRVGNDQAIRNFDYHRVQALSDSWAPSQIFRGLSDLDPATHRHVPEQAMSWEANEDYTVWTFKIRPGVRFHNGRELTAEDVKFSTERVMDPETASPYIGNFETVESIEVVDSHTMRLTLTAPNPRAEALFHVHVNAIMPQEAIEDMNNNPVGSGPFRLKEHREGEVTILERNADYWEEGLPYLDEVHMIPVEDETSRVAALRGGEVDFIREPPRVEVAALQADPNLVVQVIGSSWVDFFWINSTKPPLDDIRIRRAIAHAVDREAANQRALFGLGTPALTTVPPLTNVPLDVSPPEFDPDKARALLEEAGAVGMDLEVSACDVSHIPLVGESVALDLQAVGFNAVPVATEIGLWIDRLTSLEYDLAACAYISFIDPERRSAELGIEADNTGYLDEEIREWLVEGAALSDPIERGQIYSKAWNKYLNEGVVRVAITAAPYAVAMNKKVQNFPMFPEQQQRWETVWIDPNA